MSNVPVSRRQFAQLLFGGIGAAGVVVSSGCGAPAIPAAVEVVIIVLTWLGVIATTGYLVLRANEQYWKVESARLDVEKKQLELDGVRNGQRVQGILPLNYKQLTAVIEHK